MLQTVVQAISADINVSMAFKAAINPCMALTIAYPPCDHGAIGHCALCLANCPSCGARGDEILVKNFPVHALLMPTGSIVCGFCFADADEIGTDDMPADSIAPESDYDDLREMMKCGAR